MQEVDSVVDLQIIRPGRLSLILGSGLVRDTVLLIDPATKVHQFAAFRAEWTKGIVFPVGRFSASWTLHEERFAPCVSIRQRESRLESGRTLY